MRGKKRKFLIGALILFSLLIVYLISYKYLIVPYQIKELNDNMVIDGIPYKIGDKMDNLDLNILQNNGWKERTTDNNSTLYYTEAAETIVFNGFPDLSDDYKFILFRTRKDNFSIFGIEVGSNVSESQTILKKRGYKEEDETTYVKGKISVSFSSDIDGKIIMLEVFLRSSDWFYKGNYK
ncbi:hypothetical protein acsn021_19620 [Anaerocolumna cellulosilytica]|uniref:Uncharacterized protein n=1 Tax=Anaerocolumna cellulosilytica TaxID=433286 RepID=A0A6S6QSS2_9FIRM|nr:hypothetical protein [Anaerocolumna cellulosilytica]MBB5196484.1 hypothetical protein [Anaerocolumna cellulosilytica]BCJ94393.1 hypothetical protein acsn021_19620 [Anaerocolumna cellulosilytica]